MQKKRIAVIVSHPIQHFCPQYSSWAKLNKLYVKVFFASKHGLVPYADKNFGRVLQWDGISLDFPNEFLNGADNKSVNNSIDAEDLNERLFSFKPDVVVVYGYSQRLQRRAMRWARRAGIPIFMISDSEMRASRNIVKRAIKLIVLPRIYRYVSVFLTVGDANEQHYRFYGVPDKKLVRQFFPIDIANYKHLAPNSIFARTEIRSRLSIADDHVVILMVGKLVRWKRQGDLIAFSNSIQGTTTRITIVLAGTGPDEQDLRASCHRLGPSGVIFAGFVSPVDLAKYYYAADIYVHSSEREPHSLAISEAIFSGMPVILSDRCGSYGPTDDVQIGTNGFVYQCGYINELSKYLLKLINNQDLLRDFGLASLAIGKRNQDLAHGKALLAGLNLIDDCSSCPSD